jgi:hypothetical protein
MIVESVVVGLAVVGGYSACRCIHQKVACLLSPNHPNKEERSPSPIDPTPSFTVELVRTVLEHQARREDQSRREIASLMSQFVSVANPAENTAISTFHKNMTDISDFNYNPESNSRSGLVRRVIRHLLLWR